MALTGTDLAILSARFGVARFGASRFGFCPSDVEGAAGDEPGEYVWKEEILPVTNWELEAGCEGAICGWRPVASFTDTPDPSIEAAPVTFTDTSEGHPTSWAWDFGDGSTSTAQNPTHDYATAGTYTVTLTVRNSRGSSAATGSHVVEAGAPGTSIVTGTVTYWDVGSDPIWVGATVTMTVDGVAWGSTATTDANGAYSFSGVPDAAAVVVSVTGIPPEPHQGGDGRAGSANGTVASPAALVLDVYALGGV